MYQSFDYRWLMTQDNALQSAINRQHPEISVIPYITVLSKLAYFNPGNTCMLGMGAGASAHYLHEVSKAHQLVAVEKDPEVIRLARQFFWINRIQNLHIIQADAARFVVKSNPRFQHILVDLYDGSHFAQSCNSIAFFEHCKTLLAKNGVLAVNLGHPCEHLRIFKKISAAFGQNTVTVPVRFSSNAIIFAGNTNSVVPILAQLRQCPSVDRIEWVPIFGCVVVQSPGRY